MAIAKAEKSAKSAVPAVRVTLRRSPIGTPHTHRLVLRGLGLRHI